MGSKNLSLVASLQIHSTTHLSSVFSKAYTLPCLLGVTCLVRQPSRIVRRRGTPLIKPPCASETPLFDRSSINSFGNFVWVQGPRRDFPSLRSETRCPISPDRGALFTTTGSRGVGLGPWFAQRSFRRVSESVSRVRISFAPPLAHRKPEMRSLMGPFFFWFQRGLARPSDFRRLAMWPKSVSERPASLSIRPSSKSRRIQKVTHFQ